MTTETQDLVVSVTPRNRANFRRLKTNSIQSVKRWEKENELLYAMMEDESEWLGKLFPDVVISPEFFFYALEDGSLLCRLANYIQEKAELYSQKHNVPVPGKKFRYHTMSKCSKEIKLFRSRENVHEFLTWCRSHGIPEAILFESNDVVQVDDYREGCRGVIICLMEIVRRTAKFDLGELPQLIQMEKEIEEDETQNDTELSNGQGQVLEVEKINIEIDNLEVHSTDQPEIQSPSSLDSDSGVDSVFDQEEGENAASRLKEFSQEETEKTVKTTTTVTVQKQNLTKPKDHKSSPKKTKELPSLLDSTGPKSELDKQVCKLAQDYNIKVVHRLKEGKYIILGRIMFVRMLNDHMLVRIGGGWDTLEHYLMTHAPSKEALETPSTPSSQALSSPRNSISANSGARSSLIEKVKRKEQVGVVNRDAAVYSSQGSLNQQLGTPSSPKSRDRAKKNPLTDKDEKDITDAIRKISTSVSQTLAERPASFTSKTFHQLKVRFDKGIFGAIRRTSSPDLSLKGSKIRRRLSDTTTMADVATTLAFDGEQAPIANNNDSESKQPGETEEPSMGKVAAPVGDLLGDESLRRDVSPPEQTASDETDSVPVGDLLSMVTADQSNWTEGPSGGQVNGSTNLVDIPSFDPFAAPPDHGELISIDTASSEKTEEQPKTGSETAVESSPPVDFGDFEQDTEPESTLEFSPRPVDLGDLLLDSQTKTEDGITVEPSPAVAPGKPVEEAHPADVEQVEPVEPVASEDVPTSVQEVPLIVTEPASETVVETEPEPPKLEEESSKLEEPTPSEKPVVEPPKPEEEPVLSEMEPPKLEEPVNVEEPVPSEEAILEPPKLEEAAKVEETPKLEERVEVVEAVPSEEAIVEPRELEEPVKVDEPVSSEEGVIKTEGASSEAGPAMDETSTQEQSPAPAPPVAQVVESVPVKADEGKEGDKPAEGQTPKTEKPAEKAAKTKPAAAGPKAKSPTKPAAAAKQPATKKPTAAAARPTSPTKAPAAKKDVKAPAIKATAPATKAPATKPTAAKAPGAKATTSTVAGAKKPAAKPAAAKVDEAKKAEKPKSAAATRPPSKTAGTKTPGAARPASAAATTKPAAAKAPGKDVKDAGPPKRAPKTIATRPPSTKPAAPKTTALGTKPAAAKPTRTQSAKPVDSTDSAAASKKLTARPLSAKPKATTTTTTVKKTTTTVTKSTTGPAKTQTTTTKTVTQAKSGQPKTTTTTTTTTKTTAKPSAPRPASAAKKPAATGTKSKVGAKPTAGTAGGKPAAKSAPKKKAEEPATEKEVKHEEKLPVSEPEGVSEPTTGTEEKPTEVVETSTEIVESVSEEAPVEASPEDKSMELTPDSPEQAPEVSSEEFVEQSHVITRVVTNETTTVITDGEEQSTTTTEEATFEQSVGES